jgi:hypothetical protein
MGNPSFIKQAYGVCDAAGPPNLCYEETKQLTQCILLSITNKKQRYTLFFIAVNALRVSGGFSAHHHRLKHVEH